MGMDWNFQDVFSGHKPIRVKKMYISVKSTYKKKKKGLVSNLNLTRSSVLLTPLWPVQTPEKRILLLSCEMLHCWPVYVAALSVMAGIAYSGRMKGFWQKNRHLQWLNDWWKQWGWTEAVKKPKQNNNLKDAMMLHTHTHTHSWGELQSWTIMVSKTFLSYLHSHLIQC